MIARGLGREWGVLWEDTKFQLYGKMSSRDLLGGHCSCQCIVYLKTAGEDKVRVLVTKQPGLCLC